MRFHNIGYLFKEGFKNLWKNRTMSIASIGVLIACLLLTGCAGLVSVNLTSMMESIEGNNSITIYLNDALPALSAIEVGDQIRDIENINTCTFIPKDDALAEMMESLGDDGAILEGLDGDNNFLPDAYSARQTAVTLSEIIVCPSGVQARFAFVFRQLADRHKLEIIHKKMPYNAFDRICRGLMNVVHQDNCTVGSFALHSCKRFCRIAVLPVERVDRPHNCRHWNTVKHSFVI